MRFLSSFSIFFFGIVLDISSDFSMFPFWKIIIFFNQKIYAIEHSYNRIQKESSFLQILIFNHKYLSTWTELKFIVSQSKRRSLFKIFFSQDPSQTQKTLSDLVCQNNSMSFLDPFFTFLAIFYRFFPLLNSCSDLIRNSNMNR